jgi:hypothetical protein
MTIGHPFELLEQTIEEINDRFGLSLDRRRVEILIASAWVMSASPDVKTIDPDTIRQRENVAKQFQAAATAMAALDKKAQGLFALFAETGEQFGFDGDPKERRFNMEDVKLFSMPGPQAKVFAYRQFAERAAQAASSWEVAFRSRKGKKGRPPKDINDPGNHDAPLFEVFVDQCLWVTDGKLTIEKNEKTGTLLEFLRVIEPSLAANFVPKAPSGSALARIKKAWMENAGRKPD